MLYANKSINEVFKLVGSRDTVTLIVDKSKFKFLNSQLALSIPLVGMPFEKRNLK